MKNISLVSIVNGNSKVNSEVNIHKLITGTIDHLFTIITDIQRINHNNAVSDQEDSPTGLSSVEALVRNVLVNPMEYRVITPAAITETSEVIKKLAIYYWLQEIHHFTKKQPGYKIISKYDVSIENLMQPDDIEKALSATLKFMSEKGCNALKFEVLSALDHLINSIKFILSEICFSPYLKGMTDTTPLVASIADFITTYLNNPSDNLIDDFEEKVQLAFEKIEKLLEDDPFADDEVPFSTSMQDTMAKLATIKL